MHLDVLDLRDFYYRSAVGRSAQRVIRGELVKLWPEAKGLTMTGHGFAVPLLRPYLGEARRVIGLMPGPQGVMPWPKDKANCSVLVEEQAWPLATGIVDRLVMMHSLETSEQPGALLDEAWRVLGPGGRAVIIVPNRAGLWARRDITPFGFGRPYSLGQLEDQLRAHRFVPEAAFSTLFQPPSRRRLWRKSARLMETMGRHIPVFAAGGLLMIEAVKHMAAPQQPGKLAASRSPVRVMGHLGAPTPAGATSLTTRG